MSDGHHSVAGLVEGAGILQHLGENRRRWPGWTYDRDWWAGKAWADRWRFSFAHALLSHTEEEVAGHPWLEAWAVLAAHQAATTVPTLVSAELSDAATCAYVLDRDDTEALVRDWVDALADPTGPDGPLLIRILQCGVAGARGAVVSEPKPKPAELALELTKRVGLFPPRAGRYSGLGPDSIKALDTEAREIVSAVRGDPPDTATTLARTLIDEAPSWEWKPLEAERQRRGESDELTVRIASWLAFPFLRFDEVERIRHGSSGTARLAFELIHPRLVGEVSHGAYRNDLSSSDPLET